MSDRTELSGLFLRPSILPILCFGIAFIYFSFAITDGRFRQVPYEGATGAQPDLAYNSMLAHFLRGEFDVDPATIGTEAIIHDGKTFTYFGVFPAILRLPLVLGHGLTETDITILSCIFASCISIYFKVATVMALGQKFRASRFYKPLIGAVVVAIVFGGPQLQFLRASIYQEVMCWAAAIAAAYVYCAVRGLITRGDFSTSLLAWMSVLSGLGLLNRVATGFGLCLATTLLLLVLAWRARPRSSSVLSGFTKSAFAPRILLPTAVLFAFVLLCGLVNYSRWGDVWTFMPLQQNLDYQAHPARMARLNEFGQVNVRRFFFGVGYYFFPVWTIIRPDGKFLFQEFQTRMVDATELPPSSFFISDPLLILLGAIFFWAAWKFRRHGVVNIPHAAALLIGLSAPAWMVCMFLYYAFRYRVEFYPSMDLAAFLGLYAFMFHYDAIGESASHRIRRIVQYLAPCQIVAAHLLLIAYKVSPYGPADFVLASGWLNFYSAAVSNWFRALSG